MGGVFGLLEAPLPLVAKVSTYAPAALVGERRGVPHIRAARHG
jgi:hypothetical protein